MTSLSTSSSTSSLQVYPQRLQNRCAVVTASTEGIGLAIARRLAQEGAQVLISSRSVENVRSAVHQLRDIEKLLVDGHVCHVSNSAHRKQLLEIATANRSKKIDILVSNAAVSPFMGTTLDIPEEQVTKILDVNVKASLLLVQEFQDFIKPNGSVLFISSYIGYKPQYPLGMYAISKTALFSLTKALAQDMWDKAQVRVNCIAPGVIKTRFSKIIWADPDAFNETKRQILMGRAGETAEISGPAAFLCSDDASYITGEVLVVGGGVSSRL